METITKTEHSLMPEDASKDAKISTLMAVLKQHEAEVKVKEDRIGRLEMTQQADSEEERGGSYMCCPSTSHASL